MSAAGTPVRVCVLSSQHLPDDVRVTHRICRSFCEAGFAVTWVGPRRARTGDDYGVRFVYYAAGTTRLGRLAHGARLLRAARAAGPQDVYVAVEPDSAEVALRLAHIVGARGAARVVFDIHEMYHESMLLRWVPRPLVGVVGAAVRARLRRTARRCDLVVGVGQTRLDAYTDAGTPRLLVRHCVPRGFAPERGPGPLRPGAREFVILHGKATPERGTAAALRALALLRGREGVPARLVLFAPRDDVPAARGEDPGRLARALGVADAVDVRAPVPFREMFAVMAGCDAGLIAYDREFGRRCMPNRVFEYMAAGLPVVVPDYAEELARIVPRHDCGLLCDAEDPEALARALAQLWRDQGRARQMGLNGRLAFERELNWEREALPLIEWIRAAARA